ncbi:protein FAM200B-like [Watersipora subatra]|uniref:protein FAM200B-like n=1 Tax=Watersipora subatra TaxID=2589382 RepID=UPI00355B9923
MLDKLFELRSEVMKFLPSKGQHELLAAMKADNYAFETAYLVDIFASLNKLNLKLQGSHPHVFAFHDSIDAFKAKLVLWHTQTCTGNTVSFPTLTELLQDKPASGSLVETITEHLSYLITKFGRYFLELPSGKKKMLNIPQNSFQRTVEEIPKELKEEFVELVNILH